MNMNGNICKATELEWLKARTPEKDWESDAFMRTCKHLESLDSILSGTYEEFSKSQPEISMETFWMISYFVMSVLRSSDDEDSMRAFIGRKNLWKNESNCAKLNKGCEKALGIDLDFKLFIDGEGSFEDFCTIMEYDVNAVQCYLVYTLVAFMSLKTDGYTEEKFIFDELFWKKYSWLVDVIRCMKHQICTPEEAYRTYYAGLKDIEKHNVTA
ncbi:MAG: hypothetical protein IJH12_07795 [Clostridia bacterium]|nr:hypothetical protein [Clostridia bacterium]